MMTDKFRLSPLHFSSVHQYWHCAEDISRAIMLVFPRVRSLACYMGVSKSEKYLVLWMPLLRQHFFEDFRNWLVMLIDRGDFLPATKERYWRGMYDAALTVCRWYSGIAGGHRWHYTWVHANSSEWVSCRVRTTHRRRGRKKNKRVREKRQDRRGCV